METSRAEVQRRLRVAFSAEELRSLEKDPAFSEALSRCAGTEPDIHALVKLGGRVLAERRRAKSRLGRRGECQ